MQHFYTWHWNRWKRWLAITVIALFLTSLAWIERDRVFSVFSSKGAAALTKGSKNTSSVALTFNISWGENKVHDILKKLKEEDVQATFFVSGEWAERHPDLLDEIVDDGHELGMLGYRYKSYLDQDIHQVEKDLVYAKEIFGKLGYEDITLLRPPNGHFDKEIIELAERLSFKVIHWSVNPDDWKNPGTDEIVDRVMGETSNGDIVLLHASDSAKQTKKALETIIPGLRGKNLKMISISEMIHQAESKNKLVD